jgi:hypothetical protein
MFLYVIPVLVLAALVVVFAAVKIAMQLRDLQTLSEIGAERNSTVVFPMPINIVKPFLELLDKAGKPFAANGADRARPLKGVPLAVSGVDA